MSLRFLLLSFCIFQNNHAFAKEVVIGPVEAEVIKVIDGDTIKVSAKPWLGTSIIVSVRINGIDTPEKRSKCDFEKEKALEAKDFLAEMAGAKIILKNVQNGKYAGRVLADAYTEADIKLSDELIKNGYARKYYGGKRKGWCDE